MCHSTPAPPRGQTAVARGLPAGSGITAVACPYCLQMFEDSVKTTWVELEVRNITGLLAESLAD